MGVISSIVLVLVLVVSAGEGGDRRSRGRTRKQGNSRILPCSSSFLCLPVRKTIDNDNEDEDDNGKRGKRSTNCTVTGLLIFQS
jgi:hypothetical protein